MIKKYKDYIILLGVFLLFLFASQVNRFSTQSLDEMDINLLFSKFYTVDKSRTKGGSGLGLYIVKELLKKIDINNTSLVILKK